MFNRLLTENKILFRLTYSRLHEAQVFQKDFETSYIMIDWSYESIKLV